MLVYDREPKPAEVNYSIRVFREERSYGNYGLIVQGSYFALPGSCRRAGQGWEVVDPSALRPREIETIINSVKKTGKVLIVHVAVKDGGFGWELAGVIADIGSAYHPLDRL